MIANNAWGLVGILVLGAAGCVAPTAEELACADGNGEALATAQDVGGGGGTIRVQWLLGWTDRDAPLVQLLPGLREPLVCATGATHPAKADDEAVGVAQEAECCDGTGVLCGPQSDWVQQIVATIVAPFDTALFPYCATPKSLRRAERRTHDSGDPPQVPNRESDAPRA